MNRRDIIVGSTSCCFLISEHPSWGLLFTPPDMDHALFMEKQVWSARFNESSRLCHVAGAFGHAAGASTA
jgi:hypothetical protein